MTKLQAGEPDYLRAWQLLCDISRADFESIYSRLGIQIQERGESYYNPMLKVRHVSHSPSWNLLFTPSPRTLLHISIISPCIHRLADQHDVV